MLSILYMYAVTKLIDWLISEKVYYSGDTSNVWSIGRDGIKVLLVTNQPMNDLSGTQYILFSL